MWFYVIIRKDFLQVNNRINMLVGYYKIDKMLEQDYF